ncbi:hypothetical protein GQ53DRAFT_89114 [Thozetella sp. PMI_491]|nr:hypothetical protein GQ53DRAFT_89114 [Thozetella sp. PMI_491]
MANQDQWAAGPNCCPVPMARTTLFVFLCLIAMNFAPAPPTQNHGLLELSTAHHCFSRPMASCVICRQDVQATRGLSTTPHIRQHENEKEGGCRGRDKRAHWGLQRAAMCRRVAAWATLVGCVGLRR